MLAMIAASVVLAVVETDPTRLARHAPLFNALNFAFGIFFTLDLVLRVVLYGSWGRPRANWRQKLRYLFRPLNLIDLLALLPFLLPLVLPIHLGVLRSLRLLRLLRVLRLSAYSRAFRRLARLIRQDHEELTVALGLVLMLLLFSASLLHLVEHQAQPDKYGSVPESMWWAVSALTTVGYGDVAPVTPLGRFLASVIQILGIGVFALPAGMLAARLTASANPPPRHCPHCGERLDS